MENKLHKFALILLSFMFIACNETKETASPELPAVNHRQLTFVACDSSYVEFAHNNFKQVIFSEPAAYLDSFPGGRDFIVINEHTGGVYQSIRETFYEDMSNEILSKILASQYLYIVDQPCDDNLTDLNFVAVESNSNRFFLCRLKDDGTKWVLIAKHLCQGKYPPNE